MLLQLDLSWEICIEFVECKESQSIFPYDWQKKFPKKYDSQKNKIQVNLSNIDIYQSVIR